MIRAAILAVAISIGVITPASAAVRDPQPVSQQDISREAAAARSDRAGNLRGAAPSLYRGIYYRASQEAFRRCVAGREGSFTYMVIGGGSNRYHGTYQFHDGNWRRGLTYMMASESRRTKDGLRAEARALINKPIHRWSRYWQDRAFYTALNIRGDWAGKHHWAGGNYHC